MSSWSGLLRERAKRHACPNTMVHSLLQLDSSDEDIEVMEGSNPRVTSRRPTGAENGHAGASASGGMQFGILLCSTPACSHPKIDAS